MPCVVCGDPIAKWNKYGICSRMPECRKTYQEAWRQAHPGYFEDRYKPAVSLIKRARCSNCGGVTSSRSGICTQTPECRRLGDKQREPERVAYRQQQYRERKALYRAFRDAKSATQSHLCALCGDHMPRDDRVLDHDHACCATNAYQACGDCYRGVLHAACNFLLGWARDDPQRLMQGFRYLTDWQSSRPIEKRAG